MFALVKKIKFEDSRNILRSYKGLSFLDASNLVVITCLKIKKIATFDKDSRNIEGIETIED